jgi:hypothetical protein
VCAVDFGDLRIGEAIVSHPLLGRAQVIERGGVTLTEVTPIDWQRPCEIPVVAAPARLPPGAGAAILNAVAERAAAAGVASLRYAGPYPTPALYRALLRSFRASASEAAFAADVLARALRLARDEVAVDFAPAPHRRVTWPGGWSEVRDGVERVVIAGVGYEPATAPARFVDGACELWFGGARYARIALVDDDGALREGPHLVPACTSPLVGKEFPPQLREAIAELVAELVPDPVAADARSVVARRTLRWADLGARAARAVDAGFELHAAMWTGALATVAAAIAEALAPVVVAQIVAEVSPLL